MGNFLLLLQKSEVDFFSILYENANNLKWPKELWKNKTGKLKLPDRNTSIKLNNQDSGINLKVDSWIREKLLFLALQIKN